MKLRTYMWIPVIFATLSLIMQVIDQAIQPAITAMMAGNIAGPEFVGMGFGWIAFQAWAIYILGGGTSTGGVKAFISYFLGCVVAIAIIELGGSLGGLGFWASPIAIFIMVIFGISLEKFEWTSYVPALFVGAGAYFGCMGYIPGATHGASVILVMGYGLFGMVWGWLSLSMRGAYEKKYNPTLSQVPTVCSVTA